MAFLQQVGGGEIMEAAEVAQEAQEFLSVDELQAMGAFFAAAPPPGIGPGMIRRLSVFSRRPLTRAPHFIPQAST
jgi:hypothetical protein